MSETSVNQQRNTSGSDLQWLPYVLFAFTTIVFFSSHLFGNAYFWNDFAEYVFPTRAFAAHATTEGDWLPFWNPYSFSGTPFLADIQAAVFYPPYLMLDLLSGGGASYPIASLQFVIILHFFIAQVSMYLLCRRLQITLWGSLIAAVAYGFSSSLALHTFHPMQVIHLAWLPLIFRFFHEAVTERKTLPALYSGLLLGMTMLSGSPQMTLYILFFLGCAMLWFTYVKEEKVQASPVKSLGLGVMTIALGIGIFCIQYFPSNEFASLSERSEITYETASVGSLAFKQIVTAAVPKAFGHETAPDNQTNTAPFFLSNSDPFLYWDTAFFFGIVTLFLGLFGVVATWKHRETKFFLIMAIFGFLFALGSNGILFKLFFNLPFFSSLRAPARMMFYFTFGFCILAGFGFDALWQRQATKRSKALLIRAAILPAICAVGILIGILFNIPQHFKSTIQGFAATGIAVLVAGFAVALLVQRGQLAPRIGAFILAGLIFVDLYSANSSFNANKTNPLADYESYLPSQLRQTLVAEPSQDFFRVMARGPGLNALKRNQGLVDRVMMFEGYNQLLLAERYPRTSPEAMRDLLGIRYEVAFDSINQIETFVERPSRFPLAWMVYQVKQTSPAELQHVMQDSISFANIAVITEAPTVALSGKRSAEVQHVVKCTEYSNNALRFTASSAETGLVCFSEIWYPAWKAYVDGNPTKVLKVNGCLRGIEVPAGNHTIEMRYESDTFYTGSMISIATLLLSVGAIGMIKIRQRRAK